MSDLLDDLASDPDRIARELRRLPFLEREALLMKSRDRMTYAEIAAVLGLTPDKVEARVASGLVRLHTRLTRTRRFLWPLRWPFGPRDRG